MKLQEAIEHGITLKNILSNDTDPIFLDALHFLIEAGKRLDDARVSGYVIATHPLPGETKE